MPVLIGLLAALASLRSSIPDQWVLEDVKVPGVERVLFHSEAVGAQVSYFIFRPRAYASNEARKFPVLYWLHGSGGGTQGIPILAKMFSKAMEEDKVAPMLIVFPNGLPNGMWCDSKDGKQPVETVLINEVVPHVDANNRTLAKREGRIIEGFSMGGQGAARLLFRHADKFCAASMIGAGPLQETFDVADTPRSNPRLAREIFQDVWGNDQAYYRAQSAWSLAESCGEKILASKPLIRQIVGGREVVLENNRLFHERLQSLGIEHEYLVLPGVDHSVPQVVSAMGERFWEFYPRALGA